MLEWYDWLEEEPPKDKLILVAHYAKMKSGAYKLFSIDVFSFADDYWLGGLGDFLEPLKIRSGMFQMRCLWAILDEPIPSFELWKSE